MLATYTPQGLKDNDNEISFKKCKECYTILIKNKRDRPISQTKLQNLFVQNLDFKKAYISKVKNIRNPKLAELNYKVLHQILSCNYNLHKWGKHETGLCDLCNETQTIIHLLFECKHAQLIWNQVKSATDLVITKKTIILGSGNNTTDYVISLVAFLIYKEWLISSIEHTHRLWVATKSYIHKELEFRIKVNKLTSDKQSEALLCKIKTNIFQSGSQHLS